MICNKNYTLKPILVVLLVLFLFSCTAPRSIINSGKVTPKGQLKVGGNGLMNIPTSTAKAIYNNAESIANNLINQDTIYYNTEISNLNKTILAYSLDPLNLSSFDFYARYGIFDKVDIGYKYGLKNHIFDVMYQFKGSTASIENPGQERSYGCVGFQFSFLNYNLPGYLEKIQTLLGYTMSRKDFLIPLIFSSSFGDEEKYGCISYGIAYNHTFIKYGFDVSNIYANVAGAAAPQLLEAFEARKNFPSFGGFINLKLGYKYVYLIGSLSIFYQNYGTFKLVGGESVEFKGTTFIPTIGIQGRIPEMKKKKH